MTDVQRNNGLWVGAIVLFLWGLSMGYQLGKGDAMRTLKLLGHQEIAEQIR